MTHKVLDWNQMASIGLVERINREILHKIGLAISINRETGSSDAVFISPDGVWEYPDDKESGVIDDDKVKELLSKIDFFEIGDDMVIMGYCHE